MLERAKTLAIFDSILFSIENWATDDSPAPDFTLAAQASLFGCPGLRGGR